MVESPAYPTALARFREAVARRSGADAALFDALATLYAAGVAAGRSAAQVRAAATSAVQDLRPDDWSLRARVLVELYRLGARWGAGPGADGAVC